MTDNPQGAWLTAVSCAGIAVFAATGAIAAARKKMDLVGAVSLAIVTAIGGGTLRDLLIGQTPVFWINDQAPILIAGVTGILVFTIGHSFSLRARVLLIPDAIGLALFTWLGCEKTALLGYSMTSVFLMGVITGTAGGIIRDVLSHSVPAIFVKGELYATASALGAMAFLALQWLQVGKFWTGAICIGIVLIVRLMAIRWKIALPEYRGSVSE